MGRRLRDRPGGILGLLKLLREHEEAVEYDLIRLGLRLDWLGTKRLTWRDLLVIVRQSVALERPESAIFRAVGGETVDWPLDTHLLAGIYEYARWLVWSQTEAARQPGATPPEPLPRPGETAEDTGPTYTIEEVKAHLARLNPHHHPGG